MGKFQDWLAAQRAAGKVISLKLEPGPDGHNHLSPEAVKQLMARFNFTPLFDLCFEQPVEQERESA